MRIYKLKGVMPFMVITMTLLILSASAARAQSNIDWLKDTVSKADALGARDTYLNTVRGSGQKATARVTLPVAKLKTILDACAAKGIDNISVMIVTVRPNDVARYRRNHPETSATDDQIKWSQLVILKVPRYAFEGAKSSKINLSNNATVISLLSMGLVLIDSPYGFPATDDLYFDLGVICPPPTSCD